VRFKKLLKKMRKYFILVVSLALILLGAGGFIWWSKNIAPVSDSKTPISVVIPKGTSASAIGSILARSGLVKSSLAFKIYIQLNQKAGKLLPGEFTLSPDMNLVQIVTQLLKGPKEIWVTIPEGLRHEEIALRFVEGLGKTGSDQSQFVADFLSLSKGSEGQLFPSTYLFPKEVTAHKVYNKMISTFKEEVGEVSVETLILASLLERETKGNAEKPVVAGIIQNRLKEGWPLQIDASVQYAVGKSGKYWEPLTKADLEIASPYNTYKYQGLPPGPICNPGLASIKAAASPQATDYWFYIHDPSGVIHYAKTQAEHAANVRKYLGK
jgi:UPF0755 protein